MEATDAMKIDEYLIANHKWYWMLKPMILQTDFGCIQLQSKFCGEVGLDLIKVWEECRGKGHGSQMLKQVLLACDATEVPITLLPRLPPPMRRDGSSKLHTHQLRAWYIRHGFVKNPNWRLTLRYDPK